MSDPESRSSRGRLREVLYEHSYKRLKNRGLSEDGARRVAQQVATRAVERTKAPEFDSLDELSGVVQAVCRSLSEGESYYDVIGERPYLVTSRIDRLVGSAERMQPEVPADVVAAAKRATRLERLSGSLAVLFAGATLATLGIWCALAVGVSVSVGGELYVQAGMPSKARQLVARYQLTVWAGAAALMALLYSAYSWLGGVEHASLKGVGLALYVFIVAVVLPGFTLAIMVGLRERKWRSSLEDELAKRESDDS